MESSLSWYRLSYALVCAGVWEGSTLMKGYHFDGFGATRHCFPHVLPPLPSVPRASTAFPCAFRGLSSPPFSCRQTKAFHSRASGKEWAEVNGSVASAVYQLTEPNTLLFGKHGEVTTSC